VSGVEDLVQWLRAQLDEDERIARACSGNGQWNERDIAIYGPDLGVEVRAHMAAHDPARVLREIDAKREVVRLSERAHDYAPTFTSGFAAALEGVLRMYAVAYADRPGFREEWRP
jgi:hypothetical protein